MRKWKREEKERDWATEGEISNPILNSLCAYGGWRVEQEREERTKRKKQGVGPPTQLPWTIQSPPMTCRDHTGSLIMLSPRPANSGLLLLCSKFVMWNRYTSNNHLLYKVRFDYFVNLALGTIPFNENPGMAPFGSILGIFLLLNSLFTCLWFIEDYQYLFPCGLGK